MPTLPREWARITVAEGVEIAYTESGSGPPVVFVPGWTMSGEVFEHQLAGLAPRFRAITIDPRSHGRSTATAPGNTYPSRAATCWPSSMPWTSVRSTWSAGPTERWRAMRPSPRPDPGVCDR